MRALALAPLSLFLALPASAATDGGDPVAAALSPDDAPIARVTGSDAPHPYATNLEQLHFPQADFIVKAARQVCYRG